MVAFIIVSTVPNDDTNFIRFIVKVDELGRGINGISSVHHKTIEVVRLSFSSATRGMCARHGV